MSKEILTVYEVKQPNKEAEFVTVAAIGQKGAKAVDKKFKKTFRKILKGFKIDEIFYPFELPHIFKS